MITILIDSQKDTSFLKAAYEGVVDNIVLTNPSREDVVKILTEHPGERVMLMGHGSSSGLFDAQWKGYVIDFRNVALLKDREVIGIWCWAKEFARTHGLKGFFTSMFISNRGEYRSFFPTGTDYNEAEIFDGIVNFAKEVSQLLRINTPLSDWVNAIRFSGDYNKNFVKYNYDGLEYFDGTQKSSKATLANLSTYESASTETSDYYDQVDEDADESFKAFASTYTLSELSELTIAEIIEFAYTEGFKAGREI